MFYQKPKGVRYVDMAIWVDENAYKLDCDKEKLFMYIYFLAEMLAYKHRYFEESKFYDEFALFTAGKVYNRYQWTGLPSKRTKGEPTTPIKSVLNFLKQTINFYKIDYQKTYWQENITSEVLPEDVNFEPSFNIKLRDTAASLYKSDFFLYFDDLPKTILGFLKRIPHKKNSSEFHDIYISCVLTIIKQITLSDKDMRAVHKTNSHEVCSKRLMNLYNNQYDNVVLYNLDDKYKDYIFVLVNQIKAQIRDDILSMQNPDVWLTDIVNDVTDYFFNDGENNIDDY